MTLRSLILLTCCVLLVACGFHLRGPASLPFETLYISAPETSEFTRELKRTISSSSRTQLLQSKDGAQAVLYVYSEIPEKQILSLNSAGRVREFELRYHVLFKLSNDKNEDWIPASEIFVKRDFTFNDTELLAKESEEALLYKDMQKDAVQQLIRRLSAVKIQS